MPLAWMMLSAAAVTAVSAPAHAGDEQGEQGEQGVIAVLPFVSPDKRLEIYGVPVSRVLAGELRSAVGSPVQIVADPSALPAEIEWVIDGRILEGAGGKVVLEARLRDPDQGSAAGQVATRARPLHQIDRLAGDLARQLLPVLAGARAERERRARSAAAIPSPGLPPARVSTPPAAPTEPTAAPPATARSGDAGRLLLAGRILVGRTGGPIVQPGLAPDPAVTARAADLVHRLGRRPLVAELRGIAPPDAVKAALAGASASFALLSEVQEVRFSWHGVLTARGRVRLVLVDTHGSARYDSVIQTDTLVGSRGERHEALLGFVARQALDIAAPGLRKILAR